MADHSTSAADQGRDMGRLRVEVEGWRFRVLTPAISTQWLPDTPSNRQLRLTALVTPDLPMAEVPGSLCWAELPDDAVLLDGPLSVLGRWCGVHKTPILRWVVGLAMGLWPLVSQGIGERVKAHMVYVDEKWLKIRGRRQ